MSASATVVGIAGRARLNGCVMADPVSGIVEERQATAAAAAAVAVDCLVLLRVCTAFTTLSVLAGEVSKSLDGREWWLWIVE